VKNHEQFVATFCAPLMVTSSLLCPSEMVVRLLFTVFDTEIEVCNAASEAPLTAEVAAVAAAVAAKILYVRKIHHCTTY
jgi:hypothetical protein